MKTIFFCHHLFLGSKHPGHQLYQYSWPSPRYSEWRRVGAQPAGLVPKHKQRAGPGFGRTHALGPGMGKSGGLTRGLGTEAQATGAEPTQHTCHPALLPLVNPQPHDIHRCLSQGPCSRYRLEIATALAGFTRPVAQPLARCPPAACGDSVLAGTRTPTSAHACFRTRNGEEQGPNLRAWYRSRSNRRRADPAHSQPRPAPAREPPATWSSPPPQSGALFSLPPRNCHSASGVHQTHGSALGTVPARGLWRFCPRRNSDAHTMGKSGGRPSIITTPPCSRLQTLSRITFTAASVRVPWSAIAGARCPLTGGPAATHNPCQPQGCPI